MSLLGFPTSAVREGQQEDRTDAEHQSPCHWGGVPGSEADMPEVTQ